VGKLNRASYQLVALTKLLRNGQNSVLIADGVGVGKTIAAGYILAYLVSGGTPGLVLSPPGLVEKWRIELRDKFGLVGVAVRTAEELSNAEEAWNHNRRELFVYIVASSLLSRNTVPPFPGALVIDEIHNYRNASTALWQSAKILTSKTTYRIGLSATPINNRLEDLAAELSLLLKVEIEVANALIADLWRPGHRQLLYPLMTRFLKERLGIHFAKRLILDRRIHYPESYARQALAAIKEKSDRKDNDSVYLEEITYFRLAASSPLGLGKTLGVQITGVTDKQDALQTVLNSHSSYHVIVFCEFEATARELEMIVNDRQCFRITGSIPVFERQSLLEQFRVSRNGMLVMTAVGSEGLDLQFCSVLVNYDLTWNPMILEQRIGRIDRIGQEKSTIHIYNFIVDGSIDDRILRVLGRKLGLVNKSILQTAPILCNESSNSLSESAELHPLISEEVLTNELSEAQQLVRAMEFTSEIIPEDYSILPHIDDEFCSPEAIFKARANGRSQWLQSTSEVERWLSDLDTESEHLKSRLSYYTS